MAALYLGAVNFRFPAGIFKINVNQLFGLLNINVTGNGQDSVIRGDKNLCSTACSRLPVRHLSVPWCRLACFCRDGFVQALERFLQYPAIGLVVIALAAFFFDHLALCFDAYIFHFCVQHTFAFEPKTSASWLLGSTS